MVPMLGLAAFRYIWKRDSQQQIDGVKAECKMQMEAAHKDLKVKYSDTMAQYRRSIAHLELEQEKHQRREQSYREAFLAESRQLIEKHEQLNQERARIEEEKAIIQQSGTAGALYRNLVQREEAWQRQANAYIKFVEKSLVDRQNFFCSHLVAKHNRLDLERNMLVRAATDSIAKEVGIEAGLQDIFKHDKHCANPLNTDKRKNGRLMWLYISYWELQAELQKFRRAEEAMLGRRT